MRDSTLDFLSGSLLDQFLDSALGLFEQVSGLPFCGVGALDRSLDQISDSLVLFWGKYRKGHSAQVAKPQERVDAARAALLHQLLTHKRVEPRREEIRVYPIP